jgi:hypothetical protein
MGTSRILYFYKRTVAISKVIFGSSNLTGTMGQLSSFPMISKPASFNPFLKYRVFAISFGCSYLKCSSNNSKTSRVAATVDGTKGFE